MRFGQFDDDAMEYRIDTPATPLPWINYLGNSDFFSLISNTGGGYSFYKDAKLRRLTRYRYNNVPADDGARFYYISRMVPADAPASGQAHHERGAEVEQLVPEATWSPAFLPVRTPLDSYVCRHGLGYTIIESSYQGIATAFTAFVPLGATCEINRLELRNETSAPVTLDVTGAVEWCLWNAVDDANNFQRNFSTGEVEVEQNADSTVIYHKTEYRERRNHYAYYSVNAPVLGFDTSRDAFLGTFNGWDRPEAIARGSLSDSIAHGWSPIGAHRVRVELAPGEARTLVFSTAYVEVSKAEKWEDPDDPAKVGIINKAPAHDLLARFNTPESVEAAFNELREHWLNLLGIFHVDTGDARLDRMVNIWNQYQCMVTFNMSRSASYYESGTGRGMGFRDSNQDLLGFVHLIPDRARERILDIAATQLPDGSAWHQYQPLTKLGNAEIGGGFNDDPLWLIASVHAYLAETGDASILSELVPFDNTPGSERTLLEHVRRSFSYSTAHLGPHGLPLIGRADWNDCLNLNCFSVTPGESFQTVENNDTGVAESVFIAGMYVLYGGQFAEILERWGTSVTAAGQVDSSESDIAEEVSYVRDAVVAMSATVEDAGWDGAWFRRAYDAYQNPVGTAADSEGQIYIEPQGMCVMAGIGVASGKAKLALTSVKERLSSRWGTALLAPTYSTYRVELGEISSYPQGYKENGGIFCHNNPWISIAHAIVGNDAAAFDVYRRTSPAYVEEHSEIRRTEPYVYCQMVAGPESASFGEGKNSWLTGTAAWTFVNVSQYLLGVRPSFDGLTIQPHLPEEFSHLHITRMFRGVRYDITIERTGHRSLTVDGTEVAGDTIPLSAAGVESVHVEATF